MTTERLYTSDTELSDLWSAVQAKRRASTTALKVSADALEHLLKDHHTLVTALQGRKLLQVEPSKDQASLGA